jgi:hypothetical protein
VLEHFKDTLAAKRKAKLAIVDQVRSDLDISIYLDRTMHLEFSGLPCHKSLAFSIQAPETRSGYLQRIVCHEPRTPPASARGARPRRSGRPLVFGCTALSEELSWPCAWPYYVRGSSLIVRVIRCSGEALPAMRRIGEVLTMRC